MADEVLTLRKMQGVSWIVLAVLTLAAAVIMSLFFAWSVLAGGVIANISFFMSHRGVLGLVESVTSFASLEDRKAKAQQGQKGYLLKFWLRIVIIGIVLLFLIKLGAVDIFGLILGLSTVVFTITFVSLDVIRHYYFSGRR